MSDEELKSDLPDESEVKLSDAEKLAQFQSELAEEDALEEETHQFKAHGTPPDHTHGRSTTGI